MTTNSEARKRIEERQANCVCNPGDHCWSCGQPRGDTDNAVRPDDCDNAVRPDDCEMVEFIGAKRDTVTIEISVEDAEELVRVVDERDDLRSWLHGGSWTLASELRLKDKLQAALAGEK